LLLNAVRIVNFERFPIDEGIWPDKLLVKFPSLPMLSGSTPDMEASLSPRDSRPTRLPMAEGMLPQIPVALKSRTCRVFERFTIGFGSCPVKAPLCLSIVPKSQLQYPPVVVLRFHEASGSLYLPPLIATAFKASSEASSSSPCAAAMRTEE